MNVEKSDENLINYKISHFIALLYGIRLYGECVCSLKTSSRIVQVCNTFPKLVCACVLKSVFFSLFLSSSDSVHVKWMTLFLRMNPIICEKLFIESQEYEEGSMVLEAKFKF